MVTAEQILAMMRQPDYKPMTYSELARHCDAMDAAKYKEFLVLLNQMEERGDVLRSRADRYGLPEQMNAIVGRVQTHAKGFAFLIPEAAQDHPDVFINAGDLRGAMNGDTALVRITARTGPGRMEGEVVRVIARAIAQLVGTFDNHESYGFVIPDDKRITKDIFVAPDKFKGAVTGQKVVVRLLTYPEGRAAAEGEIIEILGHRDDPGVDILSIIRKHQLPEQFPEDVMKEAEAAPDHITEAEIIAQGRRDLRSSRIVTIDGEDAKDLDDAVNVEVLPNGNYLLGVHIADVSYYVREKSALDQEAYNRGCSVYLVDRVIPMLPHRLSNGICSLNPHVDRLTMSCEMEFDANTMQRVKADMFTSVIRTTERMTYANVRKILRDEDAAVIERYAGLVDTFRLMEVVAMKLRDVRIARGAIDFDFVESKVIVDEQGKPVDIVKRERSIAEQIIEEFMIAANEAVAERYCTMNVPFLYRVHENPDGEKLMNLSVFAANFGYQVGGKGGTIQPKQLQGLLDKIKGTKEQTVISTMLLRSMKQAKYDAVELGHFGLAADFYSHFTSPIRRYPDLVIHRVMREVFEQGNRGLSEARQDALAKKMPDIAKQSSERERVAVEAERDTAKLKKAEYMLDKVGEEFDGIISGVTNFGMFVELANTVEGLVRMVNLQDDYYHFDERVMMLIGERTSRTFRIGDEVRVRVEHVNMDEYTIDFVLVESEVIKYDDRNLPKLALVKRDDARSGKKSKKQAPFKRDKNKKRRPSASGGAAGGAGMARGGIMKKKHRPKKK